MNVILCGYNWSGCKALDTLVAQGHEVFVFTHKNPSHIPSVIDHCQKLEVPYLLENISKARLPFNPDVICSVYYRYLIKKSVIDSCCGKIFNLHPSLLPRYRGCSSLTWAIINGESETGFSYHYIDEDFDTGSIIFQRPIKIEKWDTQQTLYLRTMFESMKYFQKAFNIVAAGIAGEPQTGESSYYSRGCPHNGEINSSWEIEYIARFIRALNFPPYPPARFAGKLIYTIEEYLDLLTDNDFKT